MRWLNGRGRQERGAVAVVVAICMVVLMGFLAIAVDLGSIYSDKQQLQNGADAGALAIAESCQRGSCVDTANKYVMANKLDGQAIGTAVINQTAGSVTVEAKSTHQNWFAGVLGMSTTLISATATATWGNFSAGGAVLPLAFGLCEFYNSTGGWDGAGAPLHPPVTVTVPLKEKVCSLPAHNAVPGGFGWLVANKCSANVLAGNWVDAKTGQPMPNSCDAAFWAALRYQTVRVPIFDVSQLNGSNGQYEIIGVAAFTITGYCFLEADWMWPGHCTGNNLGIQGTFVKYTDLSGDSTTISGATNFGVETPAKLSA